MGLERDYTREGGVWDETGQWWKWRDAAGRLHRVDGPAIVRADGLQAWYLHDELHRANGPAWVDTTGLQEWWLHGERHRVDGPAYISATGYQEWHVQGRDITREVTAWMQAHNITLPFTPEQRVEFELRWG